MAAARLIRTPRITVETALSVAGEPAAQHNRSVPVWPQDRCQQCNEGALSEDPGHTYRLDLPALPNHAPFRADIDDRAVEAAARSLDAPNDEEHARVVGDALQLFAGPVSPPPADRRRCFPAVGRESRGVVGLVGSELPVHPGAAGAGAVAHRVAQVHGALEVAQILIAAGGRAAAYDAPERGAARIAAQEGLGQHEQVDLLCGRAVNYAIQESKRLGRGGPRCRRACSQTDVGGHVERGG